MKIKLYALAIVLAALVMCGYQMSVEFITLRAYTNATTVWALHKSFHRNYAPNATNHNLPQYYLRFLTQQYNNEHEKLVSVHTYGIFSGLAHYYCAKFAQAEKSRELNNLQCDMVQISNYDTQIVRSLIEQNEEVFIRFIDIHGLDNISLKNLLNTGIRNYDMQVIACNNHNVKCAVIYYSSRNIEQITLLYEKKQLLLFPHSGYYYYKQGKLCGVAMYNLLPEGVTNNLQRSISGKIFAIPHDLKGYSIPADMMFTSRDNANHITTK